MPSPLPSRSASIAGDVPSLSQLSGVYNEARRQEMGARHEQIKQETAARRARLRAARERAMREEAEETAELEAARQAAEVARVERWRANREAERERMRKKAMQRNLAKASHVIRSLQNQVRAREEHERAAVRLQGATRRWLRHRRAMRERSAKMQHRMNAQLAAWQRRQSGVAGSRPASQLPPLGCATSTGSDGRLAIGCHAVNRSVTDEQQPEPMNGGGSHEWGGAQAAAHAEPSRTWGGARHPARERRSPRKGASLNPPEQVDPSVVPHSLVMLLQAFDCAEANHGKHRKRRQELFTTFDTSSRGAISLAECGAGILLTLSSIHGRGAMSLYHRFYRPYIRAFNDAKDGVGPLPGQPEGDDYLTRSEVSAAAVLPSANADCHASPLPPLRCHRHPCAVTPWRP